MPKSEWSFIEEKKIQSNKHSTVIEFLNLKMNVFCLFTEKSTKLYCFELKQRTIKKIREQNNFEKQCQFNDTSAGKG